MSPNCRFYLAALKNPHATIQLFDSNAHVSVKELSHPNICELKSLEVSPCSNYILSITEKQNQPSKPSPSSPLAVNIWEVASGRLISSSILDDSQQSSFVTARWNNVTLGALEFAVLAKNALTFWRLNSRMVLEYQQADMAGLK